MLLTRPLHQMHCLLQHCCNFVTLLAVVLTALPVCKDMSKVMLIMLTRTTPSNIIVSTHTKVE